MSGSGSIFDPKAVGDIDSRRTRKVDPSLLNEFFRQRRLASTLFVVNGLFSLAPRRPYALQSSCPKFNTIH
jgi:hypothetical protein